ncbi:hypothetical protein QNO09_31840 [Streptomyces sp. 378]|uniref:hypothetical protein n=1 Tax=Streptomyces sp. 378 TaxID=3049412 RepID=UPI0024C24F44|nr:hypothetical protein [Streptomyces sp. 378]MDK1347796.1 hypothetical protein [Streptomyces sp. 378]
MTSGISRRARVRAAAVGTGVLVPLVAAATPAAAAAPAVTVLTHGNSTMNYGIATIQAVAKVMHRDLAAS